MLEFMLCEKFGWTITELDEQPSTKIMRFLQIMHIKNQLQKMKETDGGR